MVRTLRPSSIEEIGFDDRGRPCVRPLPHYRQRAQLISLVVAKDRYSCAKVAVFATGIISLVTLAVGALGATMFHKDSDAEDSDAYLYSGYGLVGVGVLLGIVSICIATRLPHLRRLAQTPEFMRNALEMHRQSTVIDGARAQALEDPAANCGSTVTRTEMRYDNPCYATVPTGSCSPRLESRMECDRITSAGSPEVIPQ